LFTYRFDATDLLARTHARLGDWAAALPLWQECARQQPHNPAIELALQRAAVETEPPPPVFPETGAAEPPPASYPGYPGGRGGGIPAGDDDDDDPTAGVGGPVTGGPSPRGHSAPPSAQQVRE